MPYRLQDGEAVADAIRRCAQEQLENAIEKLTADPADDPVAAVHDARKSLKKTRSLLRLARGSMKPIERRRENALFRDAGRSLSGVRDADVMIEAIDKLAKRYGDDAPQATLMTIRARLKEDRARTRDHAGQSDAEQQAAHDLGAALARVPRWKLDGDGWELIEPGLGRTYRAGRRAMRKARAKPTVENLHEWRKRCKDLWYDLRLLGPLAPNVMQGHADDAHQLSDLLGDDHDLAVLRTAIAESTHAIPANTDAADRLIEQRRAELQGEALATGERLYAERPQVFMRRMRSYWETWDAEADAEKPRSRSHSRVSRSPS
jgi:CHAD domain-containing protein